jgi:hypothetical protein
VCDNILNLRFIKAKNMQISKNKNIKNSKHANFPKIVNQIRQFFPLIIFMEKNESHIRQSAQIKPLISHTSFRVSALQSGSVWARKCLPETRSKGSKQTQEKSSGTAEGK